MVQRGDNISIVVDMFQSAVDRWLAASTKEVSNQKVFYSWFHTVYLEEKRHTKIYLDQILFFLSRFVSRL